MGKIEKLDEHIEIIEKYRKFRKHQKYEKSAKNVKKTLAIKGTFFCYSILALNPVYSLKNKFFIFGPKIGHFVTFFWGKCGFIKKYPGIFLAFMF